MIISGREAVAVRALPWLTDWWFSADQVVDALAGDSGFASFAKMRAFRLLDGEPDAVGRRVWRDSVRPALEEIEDQGLQQAEWREAATRALPAGVLVWRDEWEAAYNACPLGPDVLDGDPEEEDDMVDRELVPRPVVPPLIQPLLVEGLEGAGAKHAGGALSDAAAADSSDLLPGSGAGAHKYSTKSVRRDSLDPLIDQLMIESKDHDDLWNMAAKLAEGENPPNPLCGFAEGDIKYFNDRREVACMNKKAFKARIKRRNSPPG